MKFKNEELIKIRKTVGVTRKEFSDALELSKQQEGLFKQWEDGKEQIPQEVWQKIKSFPVVPPFKNTNHRSNFTFIDLFAGIGGIRLAFQKQKGQCVFTSEWDKFSQKTYRANFGELPHGDITQIDEKNIPDHDILLAGFPCQPFSQAGKKLGFKDTRGTLFFDVARIIKEKQPKAFVLENVKRLKTHDNGNTLKTILSVLRQMNYYVPDPEILNAYHFGVPQNRERLVIVGFYKGILKNDYKKFEYPKPLYKVENHQLIVIDEQSSLPKYVLVGDILENKVDARFTISDKLYQGHLYRKKEHLKKGNGFGFHLFNKNSPYTSTISARYYKDGSEALIEQKDNKKKLLNPRMLTPRECARLQGFPEEFVIPVSNMQAWKQFGNSVCVKVFEKVAECVIDYLRDNQH